MDQHLFDINPNPILIYETSSLLLLAANKAFREKYGYSEREVTELTLYDLRPDTGYEKLDEVLAHRNEGKNNRTGVVQHCSKEETLFHVTVSCHPYKFDNKTCRIAFIHDVSGRVNAEKKARQAFSELHHHVNQSPLAMIKWDADFRIIEWSKCAEEITGYSKEMVLGNTPDSFNFYGDDFSSVNEMMNSFISGEEDKTNFEVKMYHRTGALLDLNIHGSVLRNEDGDLVSVLTFIENITEQNKDKIRYERLFKNANDGIFLMKEGKFIECNDQVLNIYGCTSRDQILGKSPIGFSPEQQPDGQQSSEKARKKIEKALDGKPQVFEWKHLQLDGTPVDVEVSLNKLELGSEQCLQAIVRDLTDQKKAQEKLRRSEQLFRKLFLKAPGAIIMVDSKNKVQMVNQSFEDLFGYRQAELLGKDIDNVIIGDEEDQTIPRMPGKEFKDGRFYTDIIRYNRQGERLELLLGAIPVYLDGEPIAGFGVYIDVTEQKNYQRKLQESLEEKQVLLEEIHHRVKNNLAIISGLLQLQAFETQDEKTKNALNDSQLRIQSMALVHEMLYKSENFIDISFKKYLTKLVETVKSTLPFDHRHIKIVIETEEVSMDINQAIPCAILVNELVTNAYKHAFEGQESGQILIKLQELDDQIILSVADNGVGLPADFSVNNHSSIGMNLIQNLTDQLKGTLDIQNERGSCFEVRFDKAKRSGSSTLHLLKEEE